MIQLASFAAGVVVAAAVAVVVARRRRPRPGTTTPVAAPPPAAAGASPPAADAAASGLDLQGFAGTVADEVANLASGVEGNAHALIDTAARPELVPRAAEGLWQAVQRLRQLHAKLLAFVGGRAAAAAPTDLVQLLTGLREELQHMELGLTFAWRLPPALHPAMVDHDVLRDALLFLCAGLMRLERGARRLTATAEAVYEGDEPEVEIELLLEWDEDPERRPAGADPGPAFQFERDAARNLLASCGGCLEIEHAAGHVARALVRLPGVRVEPREEPAFAAVPAAPGPVSGPGDEPIPPIPRPRHRFGGVLLLESDPAVRAMLAAELKAAGRAVFACADGAAARSLLQATPERFELLIVDHDQRLEAGDPLVSTAERLCPDIKVCVLAAGSVTLPATLPRLYRIAKPFGPHELRAALQSLWQEPGQLRDDADPGLAGAAPAR